MAAASEEPASQESVGSTAPQDIAQRADELEAPPRSGFFGLIAENILEWRERRYVAQASKQMLFLYRTIADLHPAWTPRQHYQLLVLRRTGCDPTTANQILDAAQESFAQWPSNRELTLCDVVHYLAVTEFLATHPTDRGMHSSLSLVVASRVPAELCVEHKIL